MQPLISQVVLTDMNSPVVITMIAWMSKKYVHEKGLQVQSSTPQSELEIFEIKEYLELQDISRFQC